MKCNNNKPPFFSMVSDVKADGSRWVYLAAGAVSGFLGEYIGNVITNILTNDRDYLSIRSEISGFIAAIVSGSVGAFLALKDRINLVTAVIFGVGIYYVVFYAASEALGIEYDNTTLERFYLVDVLIVYGLLWYQDKLIEEFKKVFKVKKKDQESIEFNQVLFETIITGIIVSFYFGAKSYVVNSVSY